jgi:hypothetical protein
MARKKITAVETKGEEAKVESGAVEQREVDTPKPIPAKPFTLASLKTELEAIKQLVQGQSQKIADLEGALARKRRPTRNGKVQIRDKQTGNVYPSKNNAYQSLLKSGELKELVDKGIFGPNPAKNNFGWFALVRAWPDRFEEIKEQA